MRAKALIKLLEAMPPDTEIMVENHDCWEDRPTLSDVKGVSMDGFLQLGWRENGVEEAERRMASRAG